jgi:UDP-N-acetylmuramyl pentapeptide phosphotransferase/UDP-N-acetylglucosamine-1-phosphate transferase
MKGLYILYAIILAVSAVFTGEIITFVMLGFVLMALNNILDILKDISKKMNEK